MEQEIIKIMQELKAAQDKQTRYIDLKIIHKEFSMGDHVYLRFKPSKERHEAWYLCQVVPYIPWPIQNS